MGAVRVLDAVGAGGVGTMSAPDCGSEPSGGRSTDGFNAPMRARPCRGADRTPGMRYAVTVARVVLLVGVFSGAVAADECASYRGSRILLDAAGKALRERAPGSIAAFNQTWEAKNHAAGALRTTIDDPAAVAVLEALDSASHGGFLAFKGLLAWYDEGDRESGPELEIVSGIGNAVAEVLHEFLLAICRERER